MSRFIEGQSRTQSTLFPEVLDDYIHEENPIRAIDMFINSLDLALSGYDLKMQYLIREYLTTLRCNGYIEIARS